jgi:hypothetical protein
MNCRTCKYANMTRCRPMARLGFCQCDHEPIWMYRPGHWTCKKWAKK